MLFFITKDTVDILIIYNSVPPKVILTNDKMTINNITSTNVKPLFDLIFFIINSNF